MHDDASSQQGTTRARPVIGILLNDPLVYSTYMRSIWEGAMAAAEAEDVDLLCFQGRKAEKSTTYLAQNLTLFSQMNPTVIDGLVVVGMVDPRLWERIPAAGAVPTVTVQPSRFPHVVADNRGGMSAAVEHLIEAHGRRRIAFVRGTQGERGGEERYQAFVEVLRRHGVPADPALVCQGTYFTASGVSAVDELIEKRRVTFDAVVAANDLMAYGVLKGLAQHGREVPREVSVVGFDNFEKSAFCEPPLTTVHQPLKEMGAQALRMVLGALRGAPLAATEAVPTRLVQRRSCGCLSPAVLEAFAEAPPAGRLRALLAARLSPATARTRLGDALRPCGEAGVAGLTVPWAERFAAALAADLGVAAAAFLPAVEEFVQDLARRGHPPATAQETLSVLRRQSLPLLASDPRALARAEGLWHQARVIVDAAGQRPYRAAQASREGEAETVESTFNALTTRDGVRGLVTTLLPKLADLGLTSAYVVLHEEAVHPVRRSRLVMACHEGRALPLGPQGEPFDTARVLPPRLGPRTRRSALLVHPIFFSFGDNEQLGYTVFDVTPASVRLRTELGDQLAGPIKSALEVESVSTEVRRREVAEEQTERELLDLANVINALADGDLTQRCQEGDHSLGRIGRHVNGMIERFRNILAETRDAARSVSAAASRIRGAAGDISTGAEHGRDEVHAIMTSVHEMAASMQEVSEHADVSASKAQEVSGHAATSDRAMDAALAAVTRMDGAIDETAEKMRRLEDRIQAISGTVELIDRISHQARLLSLNATIQASRAGEAGRGFGVVADELRRLTDNTTQATRSIAQNLEAVRSETAPVTAALSRALQEARDGSRLSERAREDLHVITGLIATLVQAAAVIAKASREQTQVTQSVANGIEAIASVSDRSTSSAAEASRAVEHLVSLSEHLNRAISRFNIAEGQPPRAPGR